MEVTLENIKELEEELNEVFVDKNFSNSLFEQNISLIYKLSNIAFDKLSDFNDYSWDDIDLSTISKSNIFKNIDIVKDFYIKNNISFNIDKLINDGTMIFNEVEYPDHYTTSSGDSNIYSIECFNNGLITDSIVLLHELSHYRNSYSCSQERDLLSESIARAEELIFYDYLMELGYTEDVIKFKRGFYNSFFECSADISIVFKMINLYKEMGNLNKDSYDIYYNDNDYDFYISAFYEIAINNEIDLFLGGEYILGYALSTYMYYQYKQDSTFFNNIQSLNQKVGTDSFDNCLKIINLNNLDECIYPIIESLEYICNDLNINSVKKMKVM